MVGSGADKEEGKVREGSEFKYLGVLLNADVGMGEDVNHRLHEVDREICGMRTRYMENSKDPGT